MSAQVPAVALAGSKRPLEEESEPPAKVAKFSGRAYTAREFRNGLFMRIEMAVKKVDVCINDNALCRKELQPIIDAQFNFIRQLKEGDTVQPEQIRDLCHLVLGTPISIMRDRCENKEEIDAFLQSIDTETPYAVLYKFDRILKHLPPNFS